MNPYRDRKRKYFGKGKYLPDEFKGGATKIPRAQVKLAQVNELKAQIVADFNRGNLRRFETRLAFLRENQVNYPDKLAKSLCDLAEKIADSEIQLALLAEAVGWNGHDTVALNSYGTALANHNKPEKAFVQFEKSLAIDSDDTVALTSYGTALANHNEPEKAFVQFEKSLAIDSENTVALTSYGTALANHNEPEKAFVQFEKSLAIEPNDTVALTSYGTALANHNDPEKAFVQFEKSLAIEPNDTVALTSYGTALANHNEPDKAFVQFEKSLVVDPDNTVALTSYGTALANHNEPEKAFVQFEKSLAIDSENTVALTSYGTALANHNEPEKAFVQFEKSLAIEPNDTTTLNSYGTALANHNEPEKAFVQFEKSLVVDPENTVALTSYGTALANHNEPDKAFVQFEKSLVIDPDNTVALTSYGTALANYNEPEKAFVQFEKSLAIEPDDTVALNSYGTALANHNEPERAFVQFEKSLAIEPNNFITLFSYALVLEINGDYEKALFYMEKIERDKLPKNSVGFFCIHLGRLCYLNKQEERGDNYFDWAIKMKANISRLNAAKQIYAIGNEAGRKSAIKLLQDIGKTTFGYAQASQMLLLNLDAEDYFKEFEHIMEKKQQDVEMLNSAIYHKILNEISLLKMIAFDIIADAPASKDLLSSIIDNIEAVVEEIQRKRKAERVQVEQIPVDNYQTIIETISKTAHDISDFVNNEMAIIESDIRFELYDLSQDKPLYQQLNELLEQIKLTQNALNDLKAINEGILIKVTHFQIKELFEKFANMPKIRNAGIKLVIQNGESEFNGDKEKIRSFLSELGTCIN